MSLGGREEGRKAGDKRPSEAGVSAGDSLQHDLMGTSVAQILPQTCSRLEASCNPVSVSHWPSLGVREGGGESPWPVGFCLTKGNSLEKVAAVSVF